MLTSVIAMFSTQQLKTALSNVTFYDCTKEMYDTDSHPDYPKLLMHALLIDKLDIIKDQYINETAINDTVSERQKLENLKKIM